ncbi:hypothetical protein C8F01DRAFT_1150334, partial [Mycena amicta]
HLVQAVPDPSLNFWVEIRRRRVMPLYQHLELHKQDEPAGEYIDDGDVTDGDDEVWTGDKSLLANGGWRKFTGMGTVLGKRPLDADEDSASRASQVARLEDREEDAASATLEDEDLEEEHEQLESKAKVLAKQLRGYADILEAQAEGGAYLWLKSMVRREIGSDVAQAFEDIQRYKRAGRNRDGTWAVPGDKVDARRKANTMGLVMD